MVATKITIIKHCVIYVLRRRLILRADKKVKNRKRKHRLRTPDKNLKYALCSKDLAA